ncbi:hypothetical protein AKJ16_DCAP19925 [Drosera capensis]
MLYFICNWILSGELRFEEIGATIFKPCSTKVKLDWKLVSIFGFIKLEQCLQDSGASSESSR